MASLNPNKPPKEFLAQLLDKTIGDEKQDEGIVPSSSPLDVVPYERMALPAVKAVGAIGKSAIDYGAENMAKSNALRRLMGETGIEGQVFNPNNEQHLEAIHSNLSKNAPSMDEYYNPDIITSFLKDKDRQKDLLKDYNVMRAIQDAKLKMTE